MYISDRKKHCIQVFDLDLNFVQSIGSRGSGKGEFDEPFDVKFDTAGNMYVAEWGNGRVQVMNGSGRFIREFGQKLKNPSGLLIADKYVYVSDSVGHCIVVYDTSGEYVTSLGPFMYPFSIASCVDGFIHVCDCFNHKVSIF